MSGHDGALGQLLRDDADSYQPARDGIDRIRARLRARRRHRRLQRIAICLAAAAAIAGIVVLVSSRSGRPDRQVTTTGPPPSTAPTPSTSATAPSDELVTVDSTQAKVVLAATGAVLDAVALKPSLAGPPDGPLAVDPHGVTAYVSVSIDVSCVSGQIIAIDLRTGQNHVVATAAADPTVSPDGTRLAYIAFTGASCTAGQVIVEDLRSGSRQSWQIAGPAAGNRAPQTLTSAQWAPDGAHLVIGSMFGPASGIQILDTTQPVTSTNPESISHDTAINANPDGPYSDPLLAPDGTIIAILPFCANEASCPPPARSGVVTVDRTTGQITSTILSREADPPLQIAQLMLDPSGQRLAAEAGGDGRIYDLSTGSPRLIAQHLGSAGWLPRSADKGHP